MREALKKKKQCHRDGQRQGRASKGAPHKFSRRSLRRNGSVHNIKFLFGRILLKCMTASRGKGSAGWCLRSSDWERGAQQYGAT